MENRTSDDYIMERENSRLKDYQIAALNKEVEQQQVIIAKYVKDLSRHDCPLGDQDFDEDLWHLLPCYNREAGPWCPTDGCECWTPYLKAWAAKELEKKK